RARRGGTRLDGGPLVGGPDETSSVPSEHAARPDAASSVAPVPSRYERSLRPCLGTTIAPRGRAPSRQRLLEPGRRQLERAARDARLRCGDLLQHGRNLDTFVLRRVRPEPPRRLLELALATDAVP